MTVPTIPISLKGDSLFWRGMTRLTEQVGDDFRWRELRNCYISEDGTEIRRFPGWRLAFDPAYSSAGTGASLKHAHGFKHVRGNILVVIAEDDATTGSAGSTDDSLTAFYLFNRGNITTPPTNIAQAFEVANRYAKNHASYNRGQQTLPFKSSLEVVEDRVIICSPGYDCIFQAYYGSPELAGNDGQAHYTPRSLGVPKAAIMTGSAETNTDSPSPIPSPHSGFDSTGQRHIKVCYKDEITGEQGLASETYSFTPGAVGEQLQLTVYVQGEILPESFALTCRVFSSRAGGSTEFMGLVKEFSVSTGSAGSGRGLNTQTGLYWTDDDIDFKSPPPIIEQMPTGARCIRTVRGVTFFGGFHGDYGDDAQAILGTMRHGTSAGNIRTDILDTSPGYIEGKGFGVGQFNVAPGRAGTFARSAGFYTAPTKAFRWDKIINNENTAAITVGLGGEYVYSQMVNTPPSGAGTSGSTVELHPERGIVRYSEQSVPGAAPAINQVFFDTENGQDLEAMGKLGSSLIVCTRSQTFALSWGRTPRGSDPQPLSYEHGCIAANSMVEFDGGLAWLSDQGPVAMRGGGVERVGLDLKDFFVGGPDARYLRDGRGMMPHAFAAHDPDRSLIYFGVRRDRMNTDYADKEISISSYAEETGATSLVVVTTASAHGLRAGDICFIDGLYVSGGGETYINGYHRVVSVPNTTTFRIKQDSSPGSGSPSGAVVYNMGDMSKIGCDELLVWSYRQGTMGWSIVEIPDSLEMVAMERVTMSDGDQRMAFMDTSGKVYVLDDESGDRTATALFKSHTSGTGAGTTFNAGSGGASNLSVGMPVFVIRGTSSASVDDEPGVLGYGWITAIASPADSFTTSFSWTREVGDQAVIGHLPIIMESNYLQLAGENLQPRSVDSAAMRIRKSGDTVSRAEMVVQSEIDSAAFGALVNPGDLRFFLRQGKSRGHAHKVTVRLHGMERIAVADIELGVSNA